MAIDVKHPDYIAFSSGWIQLRDCYAGQETIKDNRQTYLPATSGMVADGMNEGQQGRDAYNAYLLRAFFPDFVSEAVKALVGLMHQKPPRIELPESMKPILENATVRGESLHALLRKINEAQLLYGRYGLLVEVPNGTGVDSLPYIAPYNTFRIINWDDGQREQGKQELELVVLDESQDERQDNFEWKAVEKYRVLTRENQVETATEEDQDEPASGNYQVAVATAEGENKTGLDVGSLEYITPMYSGQPLEEIPFTFINSNDIDTSPDKPPLLGLSDLALVVYRGEADLRQALFQQGQETLVVIGRDGEEDETTETRVGAGAVLDLPQGGEAYYVGVGADGLEQMIVVLQQDKESAQQKGSQLLNNAASGKESGNALEIRVAASTTTLSSIARTGALGLEKSLKQIAKWIGANQDEVKVEPNLDFTKNTLSGREVLEFTQAKAMGAPISNQTLHAILKEREITSLEYEEELDLIDEELEQSLGGAGVEEPAQQTMQEPIEEENNNNSNADNVRNPNNRNRRNS